MILYIKTERFSFTFENELVPGSNKMKLRHVLFGPFQTNRIYNKVYKLRGHMLYFLKKRLHGFKYPKVDFVLSSSVDPGEIPQYAIFHMSLHCLPSTRKGILVLKGLKNTHILFEPRHAIYNNLVCATSKASDQPAHTRSLIRAFASRLSFL